MRLYDRYALVYLLNGSGRYRDASGRDRAVAAGDVIVVFPGVAHQYGPGLGEFWDEFYLCFDGPVIELWRRYAILDPKNPIYHLEPVHEWLRRFESILGASRQPGSIPPLDEMCRLQQLLADMLLGGNQNPIDQSERNWASRTCALLEAEQDLPNDLAGFARSLGMNYESFRKRFTRAVGQPPAKFRMARLIDRACELMQQGRMSDKQIALSLGFCDEFYFSRRFKQVIGQSPRQFRQRFVPAS